MCSSDNSGYAGPRLTRVKKLNRGPYCVVYDTEFMVDEDRREDTTYADITVCIVWLLWASALIFTIPISKGTPAFISAQLLKSYIGGQPRATRTFMHDVESLLWVLVWVVAHRSQDEGSWKINAVAQQLIRDFSQHDTRQLGVFKAGLLLGNALVQSVYECHNDFSEALAPAIGEMAEFIHCYFYNPPSFKYIGGRRKKRALEDNKEHELMMSESREATFSRLFAILDAHIDRLNHHSIDTTRL